MADRRYEAAGPPGRVMASSRRELHLSNLGQQELLRGAVERGVSLRTEVRGFSMAPFIRDRDVLTIAPMGGREPRVGEVIAFTLPEEGRMAVHRVVACEGAGWLMRGDNCSGPDGVVPLDAMMGRVVRVERGGRDVRLGQGAEGAWIAALNRGDGLTWLRALWHFPRRSASSALRRAQDLALYRAVGRRAALRMRICEASERDMAAVLRHLNSFQLEYPRPGNPNVTNWVAKRGAAVIGFTELIHHPGVSSSWAGYWLFSLTVWGRYRGLGIGEALTRRVMEQAQVQGARELLLVVYEDNDRAVRLYRKLGFEHVVLPGLEPGLAVEKAQSGRGRIAMRLALSPRPRRKEV